MMTAGLASITAPALRGSRDRRRVVLAGILDRYVAALETPAILIAVIIRTMDAFRT